MISSAYYYHQADFLIHSTIYIHINVSVNPFILSPLLLFQERIKKISYNFLSF